MFGWFFAHGSKPIVYLSLNNTIQRDVLKMLCVSRLNRIAATTMQINVGGTTQHTTHKNPTETRNQSRIITRHEEVKMNNLFILKLFLLFIFLNNTFCKEILESEEIEKLTNLFIEFLSIGCEDEIPSEDLIIESMKFNYKQFLDSLINSVANKINSTSQQISPNFSEKFEEFVIENSLINSEFDCTKEENIDKIVKMFEEKSKDKQMHNIHYLTIKYLIKNSQKIQKFFDDYTSKNRLYILIGSELGNLEIEYPIWFPIDDMESNYQWYLYKRILLLEEKDGESLYLTEEELEKSINAEMRINASLLLVQFRSFDYQAEEFYNYDETNKTCIKFKEIVEEIENIFYDLIKKRIEIANCFIYTYSIIIEKASTYWDKNNLTAEENKKFDKEIKELVGKFKDSEFKKIIKKCEDKGLTLEGKVKMTNDQREALVFDHFSHLKYYLNENQKEKEKLTKSFKSKSMLHNLIIDNDKFANLYSALKLEEAHKYFWDFYCHNLKDLKEGKWYNLFKYILDVIEEAKSADETANIAYKPNLEEIINSTDESNTSDIEKRIKEVHLTTLGNFHKNETFRKDLAIKLKEIGEENFKKGLDLFIEPKNINKIYEIISKTDIRTEEEREAEFKAKEEEYLKNIALWEEELLKEESKGKGKKIKEKNKEKLTENSKKKQKSKSSKNKNIANTSNSEKEENQKTVEQTIKIKSEIVEEKQKIKEKKPPPPPKKPKKKLTNKLIGGNNEEQKNKNISLFSSSTSLNELKLKINSISEFTNEQIINKFYLEFIENPSIEKRNLIDIGIIINEIYKRFVAFKQLKEKIWPLIYEEIFGEEILEKMPKWLEKLIEDDQNFDKGILYEGYINKFREGACLLKYTLEQLKTKLISDNQNIGEYGPAKYLNPELIQNLIFSEENEESNYNYEIFELIELNKNNNKNINEIIKKLKNILNKWAEIFEADYEFLIGGSLMLEVNTKNSDIDAIYVVKENTKYFYDEERGEENLNNDETKQLISRATQFFGPLNSKCLDNKEENCSDLSFYCYLCVQDKVNNLKRIRETRVPLLKFEFYGIDIDISYVQIPEEIKDNKNWMDEALNNAMNNSLGRVFPLSGYKSNLIIKELLRKEEEQKMKIFRSALILLKIWAKNNSIYGNQFGFLSGTSMLIMLTKFYLLYPNTCSVLVIIDRFFLTFLTWNWPRPFLIGAIDDSLIHSWRIDTELFSREITFLNKQGIEEDWVDVDKRDKIYIKMETEKLKENEKGNIERLEKHSKLIMPILTPAYPQQSSAFNVNYSTMKIIKQTIIEG
uniref:polynucleotide adenylyltransferase n=1 Tax=Meloidogyne floridensis TaxID=298350 RepID=A0A915NU36_9BILA